MKKGCFTPLVIIIVLILATGIGSIYYLYAKEQEPPVRYDNESAEQKTIVNKSVATGAVVPRDEVLIKPQISGIVKQLRVEAGQTVNEGDILAVVQVVPNMANLNAAENRINRAQINLDNVKLDYNRNSSLLEKGVISQADFQPFSMNKMNAEQELKAAQESLQIVQNGVAKRNRGGSNTDIRSTVSGMILDVPIKVGNSVIEANTFNEGTTVATIANMKDLIFEGKIDESEVEKLKEGMELILTIGAIEGETFKAVLEYISPKGIEENGAVQFNIKAAVSLDENQFVRAGYSATADVVLDKREDVMAINESLLQFEKDGSAYVEVKINENEYEKRTVELGLSDGIYVEVLEGVKAEDEIKAWNSPIKDF
ncbi:MAG TPA: efflux transporter periplasmic adaptor subunit [Flavobacteriales bacterium]|nr:efflux transporter periplasmic adaptor subunit [Flavobacteriales bacterium]|tara:strand:- start:1522 stop:2631 length:1110 start_codon:yes stop_codon:yes gene_type:complete